MATFPTLSSGSMKVLGAAANSAIAMYPAALSFGYVTRIFQFLGDQEQRFLVRGELFSAVLQYSHINGYDLSVVRNFFRQMRGMASSSDLTHVFDITLDGVNYKYCVFDQDTFAPESDRSDAFSFELKIKQLRPN